MKSAAGQLMKFATTGVAATGVHFVVLTILVEVYDLDATFANVLAFMVAFSVSYIAQKTWVFKSAGHTAQTPIRFALIAILGAALNFGIMALFHTVLGLDYRIGFAVSVVLVPALTFFMNKYWVFRHRAA